MGCSDGLAVGCPVGYEDGSIPQKLFSTVGHVDTHCCNKLSTKEFRRIHCVEEDKEEHVSYTASNCQVSQELQLAAPGPEKSPGVH